MSFIEKVINHLYPIIPNHSYVVILPDFNPGSNSKESKILRYQKNDLSLKNLSLWSLEGLFYFGSYKIVSNLLSSYLEDQYFNFRYVFLIVPSVSLVTTIYERYNKAIERYKIRQILRSNNSYSRYRHKLPVDQTTSFDLILISPKFKLDDKTTLLDHQINNACDLEVDYYPNGIYTELMPKLINPVHKIKIDHISSRINDLGYLKIFSNHYPDLQELSINSCTLKSDFGFKNLRKLELLDIELNKNLNNMESLEKLHIEYRLLKDKDIRMARIHPDQKLRKLFLGFNQKNYDNPIWSSYLTRSLPQRLDTLVLKNIVLDSSSSLEISNRTIIKNLILSNATLDHGWNIFGKTNKLIIDKSIIYQLPHLDLKTEHIYGYLVDLDTIKVIDSYWYQHEFLSKNDQPSFTLDKIQELIEDPEETLIDNPQSEQNQSNKKKYNFVILEKLVNNKYRPYQVSVDSLDQTNKLIDNPQNYLINDRRMDLKRLI